jgi:hypothetical protein
MLLLLLLLSIVGCEMLHARAIVTQNAPPPHE